MNRLYTIICLILFGTLHVSAKVQPVLKDKNSLDSLRISYLTSSSGASDLIAKANKQLEIACPSVVEKSRTCTGNKHNYESMAIYYWPDSSNPQGAYKVKDGVVNPEYNNYDGTKLFQLKYACNDLTDAYYVTHDSRYAKKCLDLIDCWFLNENTMMNPNMDYSQFIPNTTYGGNVGGISEAVCFVDIIDDISMLYQLGALDSKRNESLQNWFEKFGNWLNGSSLGQKMARVQDNLGIDYDILLCRIYIYLGEKKKVKSLAASFTENRLQKHVAEDGSQPLELKRTKAMMYSIYNIQHIVDFCKMLEYDGIHYYDQNKARIDSAVAFIGKYIYNKKSFPYKEIGDWSQYQQQFATLQKQINRLSTR